MRQPCCLSTAELSESAKYNTFGVCAIDSSSSSLLDTNYYIPSINSYYGYDPKCEHSIYWVQASDNISFSICTYDDQSIIKNIEYLKTHKRYCNYKNIPKNEN